ncbi:MAG: PQQ-like beta-propeller repeat protein [Armatimonas sp.]
MPKTARLSGGSLREQHLKTPVTLGPSTLFVEATDGNVHAVETASGTSLWKFSRPDGSLGFASPVLAGDSALFVSGETTLYRLDPAGGALVWKSVVGGKAVSTPERADGRLVVGGDMTGVTALSEDDGRRLWRFPGSGKTTDWYGAPLLHKGVVYVGTVRGLVYALSASTGKRLWAASLLGEALSRPAIDEPRGLLWGTSHWSARQPELSGCLEFEDWQSQRRFQTGRGLCLPCYYKRPALRRLPRRFLSCLFPQVRPSAALKSAARHGASTTRPPWRR